MGQIIIKTTSKQKNEHTLIVSVQEILRTLEMWPKHDDRPSAMHFCKLLNSVENTAWKQSKVNSHNFDIGLSSELISTTALCCLNEVRW